MSDGFPNGWITGRQKMNADEDKARMTNDHGYLYLVGEHAEGEWMNTMDKLPPRLQVRR
jgi:hypothetical protein